MISSSSKTLIFPLLALPLCVTAQFASAQDTGGGDRSAVIEEIIVTAQKREQSLQEVPLAVTAIGGEQMRQDRITGAAEVALRTPGFTVTEYSAGQPRAAIRGIVSNEDGAAGDNSTAIFLDGVYLARGSSQLIDMYDLERVEVLRGPQGTLWGKNATAGAVNMVTRKPTENFRAGFEATAGNFDRIGIKGNISGALSDSVYAGLAFSHRDAEGHTDNLFTGENMMDENSTSGRALLRFFPSDTVEVLLSADYSENNVGGDARIPIGGPAAGPIANAAGGGENNPRVSLADNPGFGDRELWGVSATVEWDTGIGTLTSVTAYRETEYDHLADPLGLSPTLFFIEGIDAEVEESEQLSQELRLSNQNDSLRWVTGLYYLNEDATRVETIDPTLLPPITPVEFRSINVFDQANETDSFAVFGNLTFFLSDRLNLDIGLRFTTEDKDYQHTNEAGFIGDPNDPLPFPLNGSLQDELFTTSASESWDATTGRVALDYAVNDDVMVYASVARGFKSGGFQGQPFLEVEASTPFDPEFNLSYEVGIKAMLFDNRLLLNATAFFMDYEDIQITQLLTTPTNPVGNLITRNAGEADIQGLELEWTWQPITAVGFYGMYALLDTEITKDTDPARVGNELANAPENKFSFGTDLNFPLGADAEITARASYSWEDDFFADADNNPVTAIESHEVVDARIAYTSISHNYEIAIWGKNLTDETYKIHAFDVADSGFALFAPPRTYGVTVSWRYE